MKEFPLFTKMFIDEARIYLGKIIEPYKTDFNSIVFEKAKYYQIDNRIEIIPNNSKSIERFIIRDIIELESLLKNYIQLFIGFKFDYSELLEPIKISMKNIILNMKTENFADVNEFIKTYTNEYNSISEKYPLSNYLINVIKKMYAPKDSVILICNKDKSYSFSNVDRNNEYLMPTAVIKDISVLELTIKNMLQTIIKSNSLFNNNFSNYEYTEAIEKTLLSIMRNATPSDLFDLNQYLKKYTSFFDENIFSDIENPVIIGEMFNSDLYARRRKANLDYETPYFLSFCVSKKNKLIELPNIRLGIYSIYDKKIANILAIQSSQDNIFLEDYKQLEQLIKEKIKRTSNYRFINPSFIASLSITLGMLKKMDVKEIEYSNYLPLRWQRKEKEEYISEDYLINLQNQLTNKNINNFLRLSEYFPGVKIKNNGEFADQNLILDISSINIDECDNEFLKELYMMGYNSIIDDKKLPNK